MKSTNNRKNGAREMTAPHVGEDTELYTLLDVAIVCENWFNYFGRQFCFAYQICIFI
jgi:hypothetical protein